jgi:hypothetical protein
MRQQLEFDFRSPEEIARQRKIAEENGFDIITEIYNKIDVVKKSLNLGSDDSKKAAERLFEFLPSAIQYLKEQGYRFDIIR